MTKKLSKARVQFVDTFTADPIEDVDVLTSAECVIFEDGENLEEKFVAGNLKGQQGDPGKDGITPDIQLGEVNTLEPGDSVKVAIKGPKERPVFDFSIPRGAKGDSNEEIVAARKSTSGETFRTVGDRLDAEFDRIKENIEFSEAQQSEKETHLINDTVAGRTKDMIIKGKTLQNLIGENYESGNIKTKDKVSLLARDDVPGSPTNRSKVFTPVFSLPINKPYTFVVKVDKLTNIDQLPNYYEDSTGKKYFHKLIPSSPRKKGLLKVLFNPTEGVDIVKLCIYIDYSTSSGAEIEMSKLMLLEGNWMDKELPPYFEGIKSSGEKESEVEILSCGKNLMKSELFKEEIGPTTGAFRSSDTSFRTDYIEIDPSKSYLLSGIPTQFNSFISFYNSDKEYIKRTSGTYYSSGKIQFTPSGSDSDILNHKVPSDARYFCYTSYSYPDRLNRDAAIEKSELLLEEAASSSPSPYEPYKEDRVTIVFPREVENGLKGIGNFKDEVVMREDGIYLVQKVGRVVLNGSEDWKFNKGFERDNTYCFYLNNYFPNSNRTILADKLPNLVGGVEKYDVKVIIASAHLWIRVLKSEVGEGTPENLKRWLSNNQITMYYSLPEPIEHKLLDVSDINLNTYKEITHITSNNEIRSLLGFKAPINTKERLQTLMEENKHLTNQSNLLKQNRKEQDRVLDVTLAATNELLALLEPLINNEAEDGDL